MAVCSHLDTLADVTPSDDGCHECLQTDGRWVHQWVPNPMFVLSSAGGDKSAS